MNVTVCKQFEIAYAHKLPGYSGKCAHKHGHTGVIEIEVGHKPGPYPGMCVDFYSLKKDMGAVVEQLDHQDLNGILNDTPGFKSYLKEVFETEKWERLLCDSTIPPTSENIVLWLVFKIKELGDGWYECLNRVRFYESPTSFAEWKK